MEARIDTGIIVEVCDKNGNLRERVRVQHFPATIGRAYSNDIIVDDEFVCPTHLTLLLNGDGRILVEDNQSVNGTLRLDSGARISSVEIGSELRLVAGYTQLRFISSTAPVPATRVQSEPAHRVSIFGANPVVAIALIFTFAALVAWDGYLSNYSDVSRRRVISQAVMSMQIVLAVVLPWIGVWTLISRVNRHRPFFWAHSTLIGITTCATYLLFTFLDFLRFGLASDVFIGFLELLCSFLLIVGLFYGHLRLSTHVPARRLLIATVSFWGVIYVLFGVHLFATRMDFTTNIRFGTLKPPEYQLVKSNSLKQFITEAHGLKDEVDKLTSED